MTVPDEEPAAPARDAGARHAGAHAAARRGRGLSLGTGVVGLLAGMLFATNATVFAGTDSRSALDLEGLARAETERLEGTEAENAALREELAALAEPEEEQPAEGRAEVSAAAVGLEAVAGPGVEVQLWDAPPPAEDGAERFRPDDLVVHQQDLEAVMNALWAGGAEAMAVQGHRVVSTTGVRCVGNVLHIAGRTYSPPYVIEAVGDPVALAGALDEAPDVTLYRQYVEAAGLGWSLVTREDLELPAYAGPLTPRHAHPVR